MNSQYYFQDNRGYGLADICETEKSSLNLIANKKVQSLLEENEDLLVYSDNKDDKLEEQLVFHFDSSNNLTTTNLVGFIGINDLRINIGSRFSDENDKQYLIQYLLRKTNNIRLLDLNTSSDKTNIWEQLLYFIFPVLLKKAYSQGLFKIYQKRHYNDANVKGRIEINRHIKLNIPFNGNIAYSNKELSFNNPITQLVRHTIEFITAKGYSNIFSSDFDLNQIVQLFKSITPDYNIRNRSKIILLNNKRTNHPFFTEYESLRKLCVQILNFEGLSYRTSSNKVYGLLFDMSWLWEEYLNTILAELDFIHPENKTGKGRVYLFQNCRSIYPDFYNLDRSMVIDAKYKKYAEKDILREDLYQVITYMYRLKTKCGVIVYPCSLEIPLEQNVMHKDSLGGSVCSVYKIGFIIPEEKDISYSKYASTINEYESQFFHCIAQINSNMINAQ